MDPMIQETALISRLKWKEAERVLSETHSDSKKLSMSGALPQLKGEDGRGLLTPEKNLSYVSATEQTFTLVTKNKTEN